MQYLYPVDLWTDEDGRVVARVPDVVGCLTDGADGAQALAEAADALDEALAGCLLAGEDIPPPSVPEGRPVVAASAVMAAKVALYQAMRESGVTKTELAKRMGLAETEVRRMLDPSRATRIGRLEQALAVLGRRVVLSVDAA